MQLVVVNGAEFHITRRELRKLVQHPYFAGVVMATMAVLALTDPYALAAEMAPMNRAVLWGYLSLAFLGVFRFGYILCDEVVRRLGGSFVWTPAVHALNCLFLTLSGAQVKIWMGGSVPELSELSLIFAFNSLGFLLGDLLFSSFLLNRVLADLRTDAPAPQQRAHAPVALAPRDILQTPTAPDCRDPENGPDRQKVVTVLGQQFVMADILHVSAEEHYVAITTRHKRHLLRGRISDVEAALSALGGLRIHRSHWVAPEAMSGLRQDRDRIWLRLATGAELPVARGRRAEVLRWVETRQPGARPD